MDDTLKALTVPTTVAELARLSAAVQMHAEMLDEESLSEAHIDHVLGHTVASVLVALIGDAEGLDADQRALVGAAARYFVLTDDEASDLDPEGLADDRSVVIAVCEALGRGDLAARLA